jgi:hypothetical protein
MVDPDIVAALRPRVRCEVVGKDENPFSANYGKALYGKPRFRRLRATKGKAGWTGDLPIQQALDQREREHLAGLANLQALAKAGRSLPPDPRYNPGADRQAAQREDRRKQGYEAKKKNKLDKLADVLRLWLPTARRGRAAVIAAAIGATPAYVRMLCVDLVAPELQPFDSLTERLAQAMGTTPEAVRQQREQMRAKGRA